MPKTHAEGLGLIAEPGRMRWQVLMYFDLALVKYTRIYLFRAKDAPCL
jgi:hypothetical protein